MGVIAKRMQQRQAARNSGEVQIPPVNIQYAHNEDHVLMLFDRRTEALAFNAEGLEAHIKALRNVEDMLAKHKAQNG